MLSACEHFGRVPEGGQLGELFWLPDVSNLSYT